jgi:type II secretory pathway component PulJ
VSPSTAHAARAKASCKPAPAAAAKRLHTRAAKHVRRSHAARRTSRRLRRNGHPLLARRALRRATRHTRTAKRVRSRARLCGRTARRRAGDGLRFRRPTRGARLSGLVNGPVCEAIAGPGRRIQRVVFRVDGSTLNTETVAPYQCAFDTTQVADGWHRLEARALDAAGKLSVTRVSVEVRNGTPQRSRRNAAVGIEGGIRWLAGSDLVERVTSLRAAGATHTRESIAWYRVEPARGHWTFDQIDPWVAEAARQGLSIVGLLDGPPQWATGSSDRQVAPVEGQALSDYANYARRLVERYGTAGSFWAENPGVPKLPIVQWEVWNEPYMSQFWRNGGEHAWPDPGGYARMFKVVAAEAQKADPQAKFMAAVEVSTADSANQPFLSRMFDAVPDLAEHMDVAASHPYVGTDGRAPSECSTETNDMSNRYNFCRVNTIRRILDRNGAAGAQLWLTEFGYSTCASCSRWRVSEQQQADYVRDAFQQLRRWDVADGFIWWVYRTHEKDPSHAEDWMGLVHADGSPKPAWRAFADEAQRGL